MSPGTAPRALHLARALSLGRGEVAAAVGGGGKTSLLEALAAECAEAGWRPALITTTTKIFAPPPGDESLLLLGEAADLQKALDGRPGIAEGPLTLARARLGEAPEPGARGRRRMKLEGFSPEAAGLFRRPGGVVLVEADGARGLPLKAPGPEEPCVPPGTDLVLGVMGLDALGAPIDAAHVFRPALLARIADQPEGSPITPETLGRLAAHPEGLFRGAPGGARRVVVLNKADDAKAVDIARKVAYIVWELAGAPRGPAEGVVTTAFSPPGPRALGRLP